MHPLIGLIQLLAIGFGIYLFLMILYTMWGLTHPRRQTYASAISRNLPGDPGELDEPVAFEERMIAGSKGELATWVIQAKDPRGPRVIMSHGWGSGKIGALKRLQPILDHSSQIIVCDLPGHGDSAGAVKLGAGEHHQLAEIINEFDDSTPVVLYGWSMGAGVSLACAHLLKDEPQDLHIAGVICESPYVDPFTPARNVLRLRGIPHRLNLKPAMMILGSLFGLGPNWRGFDRTQLAHRLNIPLLILHGDQDPVCPIDHAETIAHAARDVELIRIADGGHNNLWTDDMYRPQMAGAIAAFLSRDVFHQSINPASQSQSPAQP